MENFLNFFKTNYNNLVTDYLPPSPAKKNIIIIDGGNTSMKFLDARGNVGNIKTARVKIEKKNETEQTRTDRDYHVKIEKLVNDAYKNCGEYLFGVAAVSSVQRNFSW